MSNLTAIRVLISRSYRRVHAAADANRDRYRRLVIRAVRRGRQEIDLAATEAALEEVRFLGKKDAVQGIMVSMVPAFLISERIVREGGELIIFETLIAGGRAGISGGSLVVAVEAIDFEVTNPEAIRFAQIQAVTMKTTVINREAVRAVIVASLDGEYTVDQASRLIRGSLGLTKRQAGLYSKRYAQVLADTGSPAQALANAQKYSNRLIRARANTVARTESIRAANEGQRQLWNQSVANGRLTGQEKKIWLVTPDDRLCPICEPLNDVKVGMKEAFFVEETGEHVNGPPAHANCRCAMGLSLPPTS